MLIGHYKNYRIYLKDELATRTQANSQYSLRAFARDLKVSPQILSLVMNGKKNISAEAAVAIANRLGLSTQETSYFRDLVELSQAKSDSLREIIRYRLGLYADNQPYRVLQEDVFKIIADWHHYALLELTFTKGFKKDPSWVARRLGISALQAREAIERLLRLELLEEADGTLRKTEVNIATTQDIPSAALKRLAFQFLEKAAEALEDQDVSERDFGSMTMAIDPDRIPEAKKMIRKFRRDLAILLETGKRTEVYTFSSELFRVTKRANNQGVLK